MFRHFLLITTPIKDFRNLDGQEVYVGYVPLTSRSTDRLKGEWVEAPSDLQNRLLGRLVEVQVARVDREPADGPRFLTLPKTGKEFWPQLIGAPAPDEAAHVTVRTEDAASAQDDAQFRIVRVSSPFEVEKR
jgi:hypothetical protein